MKTLPFNVYIAQLSSKAFVCKVRQLVASSYLCD